MARYSCPHCGSSDGADYVPNPKVEGMMKCFVCDKAWVESKEGVPTMGKVEFKNETLVVTSEFTNNVRSISPEIFKQFSYYRGANGEHIANLYNKEGKVVAQKMRYKDKTFSWTGNKKEALPFGMNQWRMGGRRITITEGELDALSVAEALGGKYPVISVTGGAQAAKNDLKEHIEFLNSYDEIVLWFDQDDAGRKAVQEVSSLFPAGKVYTIDTGSYKDANDILKDKGKAGILHYYYEIKKYTPAGIISGSSLEYDSIVSIDTSKSYLSPYPGINSKLRGLRKGELVTFTAGSGMGKTTAVREIAYKLLMEDNLSIGWVALEENTQRSALGFMSLHLNSPIYLQEEREKASPDVMKKAYEEVIANDRLYFYDHWGSLESEALLSKLRFLAVGACVDFIFLDHISIVISGGQNGDNERIAIDNLMTSLRSLAEETRIGIVIISHLRRAQGDKGFENGHEVTLSHLRGSGGIAQLSDAVVALERDQQSEEGSDIGHIRVLKNRYTGETGLSGKVRYYKDIGRLLAYDEGEESIQQNFTDTPEDF
jgi:twinkle protein